MNMLVPFILPNLEAGIVHASVWLAQEGERVYEGDRLLEVVVEGATFDVGSPATGRLKEQRVLPKDRIVPGQVLGLVDVDPESEAI